VVEAAVVVAAALLEGRQVKGLGSQGQGSTATDADAKLKGNGQGDNGSFEAEGDFGALNQPGKVDVTDKNNAATPAHNATNFAKHKELLSVTESANPLVESLRNTGQLPSNYVTKAQAVQQGWKPGKALGNSVSGGQLGGDVFQNTTNILPSAQDRVWYEADIGLNSTVTRAKQPGTRLLYSNDGLMYVTTDHYETVHMIGRWKD
ncbi:MAG: ribonuclease domain-containing protein, partial [Reinekea sp.]